MRRRILLAILLAVAVTAAALGIPLGIVGWQLVDNLARGDLTARAQRVATILDDQRADNRPLDVRQVRAAVPRDGRLVITLPGRLPLYYGTVPDDDVVVESVPIVEGGTVRLSVPAGPLRTVQTQVAAAVVLLVVLSVGTGTVVATVTARRLARPLRHVAERAARLGGGDFRADPRRYGVGELDMVADALDASGSALAQLVQRERQLVGDVTHQLRSRLTALQLRLETLTVHPDPEVSEDAQAAREQADSLAVALDELLDAAREASELSAQPVELPAVLDEYTGEWRQLFREAGRTLRLRVPEGLMAKATPGRLREVLSVLLDNAFRHGRGAVTVAARKGDSEGTVLVEVQDSGPGVPEELVPHIFDRGVSGGGSTGVGLALARALAEADGGRLELSVRRPATFVLFLRVPIAADVAGVRWPVEPAPR